MERLVVIWGNGYIGEYKKQDNGYKQISNLHEDVFWEAFKNIIFESNKDVAKIKFIKGKDMEKFAEGRNFIF